MISTGDDDAHVTFEPDGRHVYFLKATPDFRFWTIAVIEWTGTGWGTPEVAPFSGRWAEGDLSFAPDGKTAYFVSTRPVPPATKARADTEIWRLHRTAKGWAQPEHVAELGSDGFEWYPNMTADGWLYFGSERAAGNLGAPGDQRPLARASRRRSLLRSREPGPDPQHAPERTSSPGSRPTGACCSSPPTAARTPRGSYDIYVSHRCGESWSAPRPLGADVNSSGWDFGPRESPDGRFLFFTSNRSTTDRPPERALSFKSLVARIRGPQNGLRDVYRVETASLDLAPPCR